MVKSQFSVYSNTVWIVWPDGGAEGNFLESLMWIVHPLESRNKRQTNKNKHRMYNQDSEPLTRNHRGTVQKTETLIFVVFCSQELDQFKLVQGETMFRPLRILLSAQKHLQTLRCCSGYVSRMRSHNGWMMIGWWLNDCWMMVGWWLKNGEMMVGWWLNNGWMMVGRWWDDGWMMVG